MQRRSVSWALILGAVFIITFDPAYLVREDLGGDEASYWAHAATLGLDFDLDYSNEPVQTWNQRRTIAHAPIGAGILSAPFVAIFGVIDRISGHPVIEDHGQFAYSWSFFGFLFAANFWFLLGVVLFWLGIRTMEPRLDLRWNLLLALSTGVIYYVLRRFMMSHAFEFAALGTICWASARLYTAVATGQRASVWIWLCAVGAVLSVTIRISNLNVLLFPQAMLLAFMLFGGASGLGSSRFVRAAAVVAAATLVASVPLLVFHSHFYGGPFPSVMEFYGRDVRGLASTSMFQVITGTLRLTPNLVPLLVSSEFGLVYTNPMVVAGSIGLVVLACDHAVRNRNRLGYITTLLFIALISYSVAVVLWWRTTASAYGFRYLFVLYPLALIGLAALIRWIRAPQRRRLQRPLLTAAIVLGIVAFGSQLFFQANERLATHSTVNVFGRPHLHSARGYMPALAVEAFRPSTWVDLAQRRYPGFLAGPLIAQTPMYQRLPAEQRTRYEARYGNVPASVYLQTLILFGGWVVFGLYVGTMAGASRRDVRMET